MHEEAAVRRRRRARDLGRARSDPGARGSHPAQLGPDARHHQRGLRRACAAHRPGDGAVPTGPPARRVRGALPRERGDGAPRQGGRLQQRRNRVVPRRAARCGTRYRRSCGSSRPRRGSSTTCHDVAVSICSGQRDGRRHGRPGRRRGRRTGRGLRRQGRQGQDRARVGRRQPASAARGVRARRRRRHQLQPAAPVSRSRTRSAARASRRTRRRARSRASAGRCRRASGASWRPGSGAARS